MTGLFECGSGWICKVLLWWKHLGFWRGTDSLFLPACGAGQVELNASPAPWLHYWSVRRSSHFVSFSSFPAAEPLSFSLRPSYWLYTVDFSEWNNVYIHSCRFSTLDKFCAFHIKLFFVFGMILLLNGKKRISHAYCHTRVYWKVKILGLRTWYHLLLPCYSTSNCTYDSADSIKCHFFLRLLFVPHHSFQSPKNNLFVICV